MHCNPNLTRGWEQGAVHQTELFAGIAVVWGLCDILSYDRGEEAEQPLAARKIANYIEVGWSLDLQKIRRRQYSLDVIFI